MRSRSTLTAVLMTTALLTIPAQQASAAGPQTQTLPALQQWTTGSGSYTFTAASRIVVDPAYSAQLADDAATFAEDLREQTGRTVTVVQGAAAAGDIRLTLGGNAPTEGYTLTVGPSIEIRASEDTGAFYGTRSVLQLLRQSPTIAAGTAVDSPTKPERGLMVDQGRKYFSVPWLRNHIKELAYLKLNTFHFHLSDVFGFRLESSTHPEIVSRDHYTKQEIRDLVALAAKYHVTIIPEIDFPGHMNPILAAHPELKLTSNTGEVSDEFIDLSKDAANTLIDDLIKEYLPLFPGKYWHLGADEYVGEYSKYPQLLNYATTHYGANAKAKDTYYGFINRVNTLVRASGKTMRMWNDGIKSGDGTINPDTNIIVEHWENSGLTPQELLDRGHTIFNSSWDPTYYSLGRSHPDNRWAYEKWYPDLFRHGLTINTPARNLGSKLHVWADHPNAETEDQIAGGIRYTLRIIAQQTWGSPKPVPTYDKFTQLADTVGHAPGFVPTGPVKVVGSDLCVDIPRATTTPGTQLVIWTCHGGAHQTWRFANDGTVRALGVCMTATTAGTDQSPTPITISGCTDSPTQKWTYEPTTKRLRNNAFDKCLDVTEGVIKDDGKLLLYTCHTGTNQQWILP